MGSPVKTTAQMLGDAQELLRRKNNELTAANQTIRKLRIEHDTAHEIRKVIFGLAEHSPEPPEWLEGKTSVTGHRGVPCTIWSDIHYGEVIKRDQTGGVNSFNPSIARTRMRRCVDRTIDLAFHHMGRPPITYPGIVVMLGGDIIGGDIHEELAWTNSRTSLQSVNDCTDLLAGCLDQIATKFGKVFVPCVVGNHGRTTKLRHNKNMVYTNYDWSIYCNLERYFRGNKHVQFLIPTSADARFKVYDHRFMLSHGDTLGVKGGDGIIGSLGPIMRGKIKLAAQQASIGKDFDTAVICHWHQYITLPGLVVNNAVKGFDEYANLQLRAIPSTPSQALWFTHPEHGITAHWQVYLEGRRAFQRNEKWVSWPE